MGGEDDGESMTINITVLCIGKTWNACVFVIESPQGRSAKRQRCVAPRYLSRSAPQGLSITKTHKHSTSYVLRKWTHCAV